MLRELAQFLEEPVHDRQNIRFDRILVATDFSTTAQAGVDWALEIARITRHSSSWSTPCCCPTGPPTSCRLEPGITEKLSGRRPQSRMDEAGASGHGDRVSR